MRRREFITILGGAAAAWPISARSQQPAGARRQIAVLLPFAENDPETRPHLDIFRGRLKELGWDEDHNTKIIVRSGAGDINQIRTLARELVALEPDVIVGRSTPVTKSLLQATTKIPIVFLVVSDPVGDGLVASFAKPGGNVTGFTNVEASLGGKWLETLRDISPGVKRVAIIFDPKTSPGGGYYYSRLVEKAAASIALKAVSAPVKDAADVERNIIAFGREPNGGLVVLPDLTTGAHRALIVRLANDHRLPAIYGYRYIAKEGGLLSYGVDVGDLYSRAATYVDHILKGESPRELPVQAPTKFELAINLKTAKMLGLDVPPRLLVRADEVIE